MPNMLSAGYHSVMGFWRDDDPLVELILDEKGKKELDRLWTEFDFYASHTARTFIQFYFNQAGEVQGGGSEAALPRPVGREVTDSSVIAEVRDQYVALAKASGNATAAAWMPQHFDRIDATLRSLEKMRAAAEPVQVEALAKFAARAYRRPLTKAERDGLLVYYQELRKQGALSWMQSRFSRQHPDFSGLPLSRRSAESGQGFPGFGVVSCGNPTL